MSLWISRKSLQGQRNGDLRCVEVIPRVLEVVTRRPEADLDCAEPVLDRPEVGASLAEWRCKVWEGLER